jgi:hypothetical protein
MKFFLVRDLFLKLQKNMKLVNNKTSNNKKRMINDM